MKKSWIFFAIITFILIYISFISAEANITGQAITGEAVTGKALYSNLALNITVTLPTPVLEIISPENETYLTNESILINYSSTNADELWYNLDLGSNITLTEPVYLNVSQGFHILYIYANNSYGLTIKNISFVANSTFFIILYIEYTNSTKGNSTNFITYTYEDLQNLDGINLENTNYGKIRFNQAINITNDNINTDNLLDLDSNTQISSNNIQLNSTELPNFNTSATLWLYGLSFTNPRILKEGVVCSTSECIKESYSGGTLKFYVTHFTTYSAEETPSTPSGGGGSSDNEEEIPPEVIEEIKDNITIISKEIRVSLNPGESTIRNFYLMNNYKGVVEARIEVYGIEDFMSVSESLFALPYAEMKDIKLNFSIPKDTRPDTYVGRIVINATGKTYESIVTIDVQSVDSLFDVNLKLDKERLPVPPGGYLFFNTSIYKLDSAKEVEVSLKYTLKDSNGKIIFEGEEIEKIRNYLNKEGKIKLPRDTPEGIYVLSLKVDYEGKTAVTSANFEVQKKKLSLIWKIILIIIAIIIIDLFLLWLIQKNEEKKRKRYNERRKKKR